MALTPAQQTALAVMITQEGGISPFTASVQNAWAAAQAANALTTLQPVITCTVTNWVPIETFVSQASSITLYTIMAAIKADAAVHDSSKFGAYLVGLYAACSKQYNL